LKLKSGWHVVRTIGGAEFAVAAAITAAEFISYCPAYTEHRRHGRFTNRKIVQIQRPLFPCYLFVRPDDKFQREKFETSRIKLQVIRSALVSDDVIDAVRATAEDAGKVATVTKLIAPGAFVTLIRGVLRGERAEVIRRKGQQVLIRISRDGRSATFKTHISEVEAV
jgi:transcription antitermination factor NusG